jgi:hypothetical protein
VARWRLPEHALDRRPVGRRPQVDLRLGLAERVDPFPLFGSDATAGALELGEDQPAAADEKQVGNADVAGDGCAPSVDSACGSVVGVAPSGEAGVGGDGVLKRSLAGTGAYILRTLVRLLRVSDGRGRGVVTAWVSRFVPSPTAGSLCRICFGSRGSRVQISPSRLEETAQPGRSVGQTGVGMNPRL